MKFDQYQVSAFTKTQFGGNPAVIVPLSEWLPTAIMQAIAAGNNLSETAFFGPQVGVDEDPVTGSAHCALVPLWARQVSARGGDLWCELKGDRVEIRGQIELSL